MTNEITEMDRMTRYGIRQTAAGAKLANREVALRVLALRVRIKARIDDRRA